MGWVIAMRTPYQWTKQVASHFGEPATAPSCTSSVPRTVCQWLWPSSRQPLFRIPRSAFRHCQHHSKFCDYFKMLTARAMTRPRITMLAVAWMAIDSFAHRARGIMSVGLNAVELVKPRYR